MKGRLGVLISGRGSNFEAIANAIAEERLEAEIAVVISNREEAHGLELARKRGIRAVSLPSRGLDRDSYDRQLIAELCSEHVDLVCLAGYMRILSGHFVRHFHRIHAAVPSLKRQAYCLVHGYLPRADACCGGLFVTLCEPELLY